MSVGPTRAPGFLCLSAGRLVMGIPRVHRGMDLFEKTLRTSHALQACSQNEGRRTTYELLPSSSACHVYQGGSSTLWRQQRKQRDEHLWLKPW